MDPVHSWQALLSVLGAQEARSNGHKRAGTVTPFSAAHAKTETAAATPYYTPAQISPAPGPAATPIDAWHSIISTLKGEPTGGNQSPSGLGRRLQSSSGDSSDVSSPGSIRQQLFQTATKSSRQGGRGSRLQTHSTAASNVSAANPSDTHSNRAKPASSHAGGEPAIQTGSPLQMQGSVAKTQQLAARLGELRASAERVRAHDMSDHSPHHFGAGSAGGSCSSNSRATAQRLHAAGVGGSGTRNRPAGTPLSRRLFASPSKQPIFNQVATPVAFTAPAANAVCDLGWTSTGAPSVAQPQMQQQQQQQMQLAVVVSQMEELLVAVKQQQAAAMKQQPLQQQQQHGGPDCGAVDGLRQLVQQMAAAVEQDHQWQQQQQHGPASVPDGLLAPAVVKSTPAPLHQQQQLLRQHDAARCTSAVAAPASEQVKPNYSSAAAPGVMSLPAAKGRNIPSKKWAGVVIPMSEPPSSEPPKPALFIKSSTWSGGTAIEEQPRSELSKPALLTKCNTWAGGTATEQQPETAASQNTHADCPRPPALQLDNIVQEGRTDTGCEKPQGSPSSSPSHSTCIKVAFWRTVPGSSPTSPRNRSPRQPDSPASTAAAPGSPNSVAAGPGGSYAERFLQQRSLQQAAPADAALMSPRLLRSTTAVAPIRTAGSSAAASGDGAQRLRRQWTVPSKLPTGKRAGNDAQDNGEAHLQQQRRAAGSIPDLQGLSAGRESNEATHAELAAATAATAESPLSAAPFTESVSTTAAGAPQVSRSRNSNLEQLNVKFQALSRDWSSMTDAHSSSNTSSRCGTAQSAGITCQTAVAVVGNAGVRDRPDESPVPTFTTSGPSAVSTPVVMDDSTSVATTEGSMSADVSRVANSTSTSNSVVESASPTIADAAAAILHRPNSNGTIGNSSNEQRQQQKQKQQAGLEGSITPAVCETAVGCPVQAADGSPLQQALCCPASPVPTLPRVHTPGKGAAAAAAETATPMLANSTAAVLNLSEETDDTQAKWKQLLDEWSADDLPLNTSCSSSTNLLPSDHSATLISTTDEASQMISAAGGDATRAGSTTSESAQDGAGAGAVADQGLDNQNQHHRHHRQQQQQHMVEHMTESSPARTYIHAAVNPLCSPGSAIESEASELSLAALTIKAAGQQQQQQTVARAPDATADVPTVRQLFIDGSTPTRPELVGNSQPTGTTHEGRRTMLQQRQELLGSDADQPQQQLQGSEAETSSKKLLASLEDTPGHLAAEQQQQRRHQAEQQADSSQASGVQQQQQAATDPAVSRQHSQALQRPVAAGHTVHDRQAVSQATLADVASTADDTRTDSAVTSDEVAATAAASAAGHMFVTVNTEDSFKQLLVGLREVHDRLAAERQQQHEQQQHRMMHQQHSRVSEESFDGLLLSLRDVHDQLAALRHPRQQTTAATRAAVAAAGPVVQQCPPGNPGHDIIFATAKEVHQHASAVSSSSTSNAASGQVTPSAQLSRAPTPAQAAATKQAAAVVSALAAHGDCNLLPGGPTVSQAPKMRGQTAVEQRTASPLVRSSTAAGNITSTYKSSSLARHTPADERFSVLRQRLQESRAALQAIGMPAADAGTLTSAATSASAATAAEIDVPPLALPVSGWLKANSLHHYLTRSRSQQGQPAAAAAVDIGASRHQGPSSHVHSLVHKWRTEALAKSQSESTPAAAHVTLQQRQPGPDVAGLGLSPLSPLHIVSRTAGFEDMDIGPSSTSGSSTQTPATSLAAVHTLPATKDFAYMPGIATTPAAVVTAPPPADLLFPMSPLLSSSTGAAAGFRGSSAGTAAAARAAGLSSAFSLAAARGLQNLSKTAESQQGSWLTTPHSQSESAYSASNSPPSVNMLQHWVRHGSPTKRMKQQLRSRVWQEQQQQQRNQQQQKLDAQLGHAQAALQDLDRSRAALHAATHAGAAVSSDAVYRLQQQPFQGSDTSVAVADQTAGVLQLWSGTTAGKSPAAVLAATAAVAEDAAAALASAAVTSGSARSISPTSRLKGLRVQQAVAVSSQQQQGPPAVTVLDARQRLYWQQPPAAGAAAVSAVSPRYNVLQSAASGSSRAGTWLQAAAVKRQESQNAAARLETAAAGLADVRRQLAASGASRGSNSRVTLR